MRYGRKDAEATRTLFAHPHHLSRKPHPPPPPPPPPTPPPARTTDATKETHDDKRSASKNMSKAFAVPACRVLEVADEGSNKFVEQLHATSYPLIVSGGS